MWDMVYCMLLIEQQGDVVLYVKMGVVMEYQLQIGWWVGWVECVGCVYVFVLNIDMLCEGDMVKCILLGKQLMQVLEVWLVL